MQNESHGISSEVEVKFSCPKCQARYGCLSSEIQGLEPEFHCRKCQTHFGFRFDPDLVFSGLQQSRGGLSFEGYVLEKKRDAAPSLSPFAAARQGLNTLDQSWEEVKRNWGNLSFHRKFIDYAVQTKKISYAANRYQRVLEENPSDAIAQKMRLDLIEEASQNIPAPSLKDAQKTARRSGVLFIINLVGVILIGLGIGVEGFRQLIAVGAATFVLTFGFSKLHFDR